MSGDQLQQMLDKLQQLMEEGRTAEAQELMETLRQLMENMQVTQGQGGQGRATARPAGDARSRKRCATSRACRTMPSGHAAGPARAGSAGNRAQEQGQQGQDQQGQGQQPGTGQGEGSSPAGRGRSLAERQQDLRNRLNGLSGLPGEGTEAGEAGRQALEDAGTRDARGGTGAARRRLSGALDRQADAMEAMREGMRNFGEAMAQEQQRQDGAAARARPSATPTRNGQRDPLGREPGEGPHRVGPQHAAGRGRLSPRTGTAGRNPPAQGEQARPEAERDYLRRLLDLF